MGSIRLLAHADKDTALLSSAERASGTPTMPTGSENMVAFHRSVPRLWFAELGDSSFEYRSAGTGTAKVGYANALGRKPSTNAVSLLQMGSNTGHRGRCLN